MIDRRWVGYGPPNYPFVLNRESSQAKGLVSWWPTVGNSAGSSILKDRVGINNLLFGGGTANPLWASSLLGIQLLFDGIDDFISGSVLGLPVAAEPRTVTCWVISTAIRTPNNDNFIFSYGGVFDGERFALTTASIAAANNVLWRHIGGSIRYPADILVGVLFHVAMVVPVGATTTNDVIVYIDGIFSSGVRNSGADQPLSTVSSDLYIGKNPTFPTRSHAGFISDFRIYNRALTPIEVYQLYAPQTRWELYQPVQRTSLAFVGPSPVYPGRNHPSRNILLRL